jgi:DNA-directed RNA polymerase alpha subunit
MTKISITKDTKSRLEFTLSDSDIAFANLLRRTMIANIPIMAIDFVFIKHNTCYKSNTLAHLIGLIPAITDVQLPVQCTNCESFCDKCSREIILDEKNETDKIRKIYSDSFKSDEIKLLPKMPIVKLKKGEYINIKAHLTMNIGKKHAKWQPVSVAGYNYTKPHATEFEFYVETTGSFTNREILRKALEIIRDNVKNLLLKN